jgi:hypothetical protein
MATNNATEKESENISNFQSFAAEGDNLSKQGSFLKAVEAYTKVFRVLLIRHY